MYVCRTLEVCQRLSLESPVQRQPLLAYWSNRQATEARWGHRPLICGRQVEFTGQAVSWASFLIRDLGGLYAVHVPVWLVNLTVLLLRGSIVEE